MRLPNIAHVTGRGRKGRRDYFAHCRLIDFEMARGATAGGADDFYYGRRAFFASFRRDSAAF